jgi:hypothetical protein
MSLFPQYLDIANIHEIFRQEAFCRNFDLEDLLSAVVKDVDYLDITVSGRSNLTVRVTVPDKNKAVLLQLTSDPRCRSATIEGNTLTFEEMTYDTLDMMERDLQSSKFKLTLFWSVDIDPETTIINRLVKVKCNVIIRLLNECFFRFLFVRLSNATATPVVAGRRNGVRYYNPRDLKKEVELLQALCPKVDNKKRAWQPMSLCIRRQKNLRLASR